MKYIVEIWTAKINKENAKALPIIIPLLIHHGRSEWRTPPTLSSMLNGYELLPDYLKIYVPNFEYSLYDLSTYTDDEIKGKAQTRIQYLETMIRYVFSAAKDLTSKDIVNIINQFDTTYPEGSEVAMTLADMWREEGMEKGMQKGEAKALFKMAV